MASESRQALEGAEYARGEVIETSVAIQKAGDGLSESLKTEPRVLDKNDTVYVVLECNVAKVHFDPVKGREDEDEWRRVHVLHAGTATFLDGAQVKDAIEAQAKANQERRDRESGQGTLEEQAAEALRSAHVLGEHSAGLVAGCDLCDKERDEAAWEAAEGDKQ